MLTLIIVNLITAKPDVLGTDSKFLLTQLAKTNLQLAKSMKGQDIEGMLALTRVVKYDSEVEYNADEWSIIVGDRGWMRVFLSNRRSELRDIRSVIPKISEEVALSKVRSFVRESYPKWTFDISRYETGVRSNGILQCNAYGFHVVPNTNGVLWGPEVTLAMKVDFDFGHFSFANFCRPPVSIQKPDRLISESEAEQKALQYAVSLGAMPQAEVKGKPRLFITFDGLGILNRKNPLVQKLKGENIGIYAYWINITRGPGKNIGYNPGPNTMDYLISAEDGSILRGQTERPKF